MRYPQNLIGMFGMPGTIFGTPGAGENVLNKCGRFTTELTRGLRLQRCRIQCRTPRETGKHVGVTSILFVRRVPVADLKQYLSPAFDT